MAIESAFRGLRGIEEIITRITPLMNWTKQFKPDQKCLRLERKDYDLIKRWPKASNVLGITVLQAGQGGVELWWRGLELTYATGQGRYEKLAAPIQTDITEASHG